MLAMSPGLKMLQKLQAIPQVPAVIAAPQYRTLS